MLEKIHQHIVSELNQGAKTDTIFVITAIVFNLIVLGVNSGVAGSATNQDTYSAVNDVVLIVFVVLLIFVNIISVTALTVGKQTRHKLLNGLLAMYSDNEVDKYYDTSLLTNYDKRYTLFTGVILCLAATAVVVPLIIRFV
ncbi:MAG: hypothetical protein H6667_02810 [Ardenticatenaceae bacterium]|nr:hypothetical protein [Ardenticatenaceae bacterium]MCB9442938.1 hypothetical protein [Ardenticatenaceae bacterium]